MIRTHVMIGLAAALFLLTSVENKLVFLPVVLLASALPDLDTAHSSVGSKWYFRPLQFFTTHRGVMHSLTICFVISMAFAFYIPVLALPFFLGYSLHLVGDSFTIDGIRPFWPLKKEVEGRVRTGGVFESGIFYSAVLVNILLFVWIVLSY